GPRKADQLAREIERQAQIAVARVEPGFAHPRVGDALVGPAPDNAGERGDDILRQSKRLPDLADRAAGAIADDGRGDAGAVAAVFVVDVLDDLLAPLAGVLGNALLWDRGLLSVSRRAGRLCGRDARGPISGEFLGSALPSQLGQPLLGCEAGRYRLLGIFVAQFVEAEPAARDDFERAGQRVLIAAEQPRHFRRRLQMTLGMSGEAETGFRDRA